MCSERHIHDEEGGQHRSKAKQKHDATRGGIRDLHVEINEIDQPSDERPCLLDVPCPVAAPRSIRPQRSAAQSEGQKRESQARQHMRRREPGCLPRTPSPDRIDSRESQHRVRRYVTCNVRHKPRRLQSRRLTPPRLQRHAQRTDERHSRHSRYARRCLNSPAPQICPHRVKKQGERTEHMAHVAERRSLRCPCIGCKQQNTTRHTCAKSPHSPRVAPACKQQHIISKAFMLFLSIRS